MAGYFSNLSRLQNTSTDSQQSHSQSQSQQSQSSTRSNTPASASASADPPRSRSRAMSSRHFSTSVTPSPSQGTKTLPSANAGTLEQVHPLRTTWVFWFRAQRAPGDKIKNYEEGIKRIAAVSSVESFWSTFTHLAPPSALAPTTDYLLFHAGVRRPIWEDAANMQGGKWILRLKKGVADRVWEELVLAVVGDQFEDGEEAYAANGAEGEGGGLGLGLEICGVSISVRLNEDIVSLWNRVEADVKSRERHKETLKRVLNLSPATTMEYKSNNDSMQDRSSFRTPGPLERHGSIA